MSKKVTIDILGDGDFAGASSAVADYSINEDATPTSLHTLAGGVGGITFDAVEDPGPQGTILLRGESFRLNDPYAGRQVGVIDAMEVDNGIVKVEASGSLVRTVVTRRAPAYSGTVSGALTAWFALCNWNPTIRFEGSIGTSSVTLPAWEGEVWAQIKKLAVIRQFDISEINGIIVVRPLRSRWIDFSEPITVRNRTYNPPASHAVEVYYYNNSYQTNAKVYPLAGEALVEGRILQVEASETLTTNLPVNMWVNSVDQLTQVTSLAQSANPTGSTFAVVDKDGRAVTPSDWQNAGGSATVKKGADGKSIDITIRGMSTSSRGPFRIASSSQDRTFQYPALYIIATGVAFTKKMISSYTGAGAALASVDEITVIDDPMVSSVTDAGRVLDAALTRLAGHGQTLSVSAMRVNRRGESGFYTSASFSQYNAEYPTETFTEMNAIWGTSTFKQFNAEQIEEGSEEFMNQAYGSMGGARVRYRDTIYRVTTARGGPGGFSWDADFDTTFDDFNPIWPDETFSDFNSEWADRTFMEQAASPLWRA